ncbi:MAG: Ig-like domain-containing protein, partial [Actinomycetota bacterium]
MNVMLNSRVLCTFAQPMDLNSLRTGGVEVGVLTTTTFTPVSISDVQPVTSPANTFDVLLSSNLSANTTYAVIVNNLAQTFEGVPIPAFYSNFGTQIVASKLASTVPSVAIREPETFGPVPAEFNPPHRRVNLMAETRLFVTFNTSVTNVDPASMQIMRITTPIIPISVSSVVPVTSPPFTFEVVPSAPLRANTTYSLHVTNRVEALSRFASPGDEMEFSTRITQISVGAEKYTTITTSPDVVGPFLFLTNPNNGDFNSPLNSEMTVTFNESIVDSSITSFPNQSVAVFRLTTPVINLGPVTVSRATTPANTYRIQFSPSVPLTADTTYAILISNNIEDNLGNHAQPGSVQFSTTIQFGGLGGFAQKFNGAMVASLSLGAGGVNAFPALLVTQLLMSDQLAIGRSAP